MIQGMLERGLSASGHKLSSSSVSRPWRSWTQVINCVAMPSPQEEEHEPVAATFHLIREEGENSVRTDTSPLTSPC